VLTDTPESRAALGFDRDRLYGIVALGRPRRTPMLNIRVTTLGVIALICTAQAQGPPSATGGPATYRPPRTSWGDPNLEGKWPGTNMGEVPLQRPESFGTRNVLTDAEFAERQAQVARRVTEDNADFDFDHPSVPFGQIGGGQSPPEYAKLYVLLKRRPELALAAFRKKLIDDRAGIAARFGLNHHLVGFSRDPLYGFGEPPFDAIELLAVRDLMLLETLLADRSFSGSLTARPYVHETYAFNFVAREHWIIPPGGR